METLHQTPRQLLLFELERKTSSSASGGLFVKVGTKAPKKIFNLTMYWCDDQWVLNDGDFDGMKDALKKERITYSIIPAKAVFKLICEYVNQQ